MRGALILNLRLGKNEMLEEQAPNQVYPTENQTEESNENSYYYGYKALGFKGGRPSYENFRYPVDNGDQQKEYLNETALFIKPGCKHFMYLLLIY